MLPTNLYLSVINASATTSLNAAGDTSKSSESWSLVLRSSPDTNIVLSTGHRLADIDIHFTLSTKWRTRQELDRDLAPDAVGFLSHNEGEQGEPFVHGEALLLNTTIVAALLSTGITGKVRMEIPTVPFVDGEKVPFVWGSNRPNMLHISHIEISVLRSDG